MRQKLTFKLSHNNDISPEGDEALVNALAFILTKYGYTVDEVLMIEDMSQYEDVLVKEPQDSGD